MNGTKVGTVQAVEYRDANPMVRQDTSVLELTVKTPDAERIQIPLSNPEYMVHNPALQFFALYGLQPTDIGGTRHQLETPILVQLTQVDGEWRLADVAMLGGEDALREAEWFDAADDSDDDGGPQGGGGGSADPSTGNRGGVEYEGDDDITAELAGDESDSGVEVTIE